MSEHGARSCQGKRRYASERRALVYAKETGISAGVAMRAYACAFCKGWHVGSVEPHGEDWARMPRAVRNQTYLPHQPGAPESPR